MQQREDDEGDDFFSDETENVLKLINQSMVNENELQRVMLGMELLSRPLLRYTLNAICYQPGYDWGKRGVVTVARLFSIVQTLLNRLQLTTQEKFLLACNSAVGNNPLAVRAVLQEIPENERNNEKLYSGYIRRIVETGILTVTQWQEEAEGNANAGWGAEIAVDFFGILMHERKFDRMVLQCLRRLLLRGDASRASALMHVFAFQHSPLFPDARRMAADHAIGMHRALTASMPGMYEAIIHNDVNQSVCERWRTNLIGELFVYEHVRPALPYLPLPHELTPQEIDLGRELVWRDLLHYIPTALRRVDPANMQAYGMDMVTSIAERLFDTGFLFDERYFAFTYQKRIAVQKTPAA